MSAQEGELGHEGSGNIQYRYGNKLDLFLLKRNVQRNYRDQIAFWREKARHLYSHSMPVGQCILCGSSAYTVVGHTYGWPWQQCLECTHVYNGRRLSSEKYLEFYQVVDEPISYSDTYTDAEVQNYRMKFVALPKVEHIAKHCQNHSEKDTTWLDVGTGNGDVVYLADQKGFKALGIEINPASVEYGKSKWGVNIYLGRIEEFEKENRETWDIISFLGISDIIINPIEYIQIAYRLLNKNGIMAMSFPNFNSLSRAVQFTYPDQLVCRFLYPSVVSCYTEKSARQALEREGFDIISIWYFGMDVYELINNLSISDSCFENSEVYSLLRRLTIELQMVCDSHKMSDEFLVVARKKR